MPVKPRRDLETGSIVVVNSAQEYDLILPGTNQAQLLVPNTSKAFGDRLVGRLTFRVGGIEGVRPRTG